MTDLIHVPFRDGEVLAVDVDGKPHVVLKPFIEALGLDFDTQRRKLRSRSWAVTGERPATGSDGKTYRMLTADVRTALILLATINENNVAEDKRPLLIAYQAEVADVIEAYWTRGGAINPRATEEQLTNLVSIADQQMHVIQLARGIIHDDYLEAKARIVLARAMGEEPELDSATIPVDVTSYLSGRGVQRTTLARYSGPFGKRLKALYTAEHGHEPDKVDRVINGTFQRVNGYTRRDLPLFDRVYAIMRTDLENPALAEVAS